jgi:hypothetical protein
MRKKIKEHDLKPLHIACSDCDLREGLQYIYANDGILTATNGHVLVRHKPITDIPNLAIHRDVYKLMYDSQRFEFDALKVRIWKNDLCISIELKQPDNPCNYLAVLKYRPSVNEPVLFNPVVAKVGLDALRTRLDDLHVHFQGNNKPVIYHNDDMMIMIMPFLSHLVKYDLSKFMRLEVSDEQ